MELVLKGFLIGFAAYLSLSVIKAIWLGVHVWVEYYKLNKKNHNQLLAQKKMKEDMGKNGDMHEWINMTKYYKGEVHDLLVCKKTGWCPKLNGFISLEQVKKELDKIELEQQYQVFRNLNYKQLAEKYNLPIDKLEEISEDIYNVKKQFYLNKIDKGG